MPTMIIIGLYLSSKFIIMYFPRCFFCYFSAEGDSFGEVALLTDDCMRTATVIAGLRAAGRTRGGSREGGRRPVIRGGARTKGDPGESVDLLVLHRDLYERSIACLVSRDVEQRIEFLQVRNKQTDSRVKCIHPTNHCEISIIDHYDLDGKKFKI